MILITGAAGFIGSVIAAALNRKGHRDLILCDHLRNADKWKNLLGLSFQELIDPAELFLELAEAKWSHDIQAVIHMGACATTTETDADFLAENNTRFSQRLCEWSLANGARFIYASSAATYGDGSLGFSDSDELTPKLKPLNAYGFSKWLFDLWVLEHNLQNKVCGLRFFNVFGPNEYHKDTMASVIYRAFPLAKKDGIVRLFESYKTGYAHGEQKRDFVYVDEVLSMIFYLLEHPQINGIFNAGSGHAHSFNQLAESLLEAVGKARNIHYFPMPEEIRDRYQYYTVADMSKLYQVGFPELPDRFSEYVKRYVSEYLVHDYLRYQDS